MRRCPVTAEPSADQLSPRRLIDSFHRAMIALSANDLANLHASDAVYEFPLLTPGRPERYQGREEIRAGFSEVWAAASARITVDQICNIVLHETSDPEVVVIEQEAAATDIATGIRFFAPSLIIVRVRGGLIQHVRDYSAGTRRPDRVKPDAAS